MHARCGFLHYIFYELNGNMINDVRIGNAICLGTTLYIGYDFQSCVVRTLSTSVWSMVGLCWIKK